MPPAEVLRALLAGLIAGVVVALLSTAVVLVVLWRDRSWFERVPQLPLPPALVGVVVVNGFLLAWTALGLLFGAAFLRFEVLRGASGLGSPNVAFTLVVLAVSGAALGGSAFVRGRVTWPWFAVAAGGCLSFGWLLPWLAA